MTSRIRIGKEIEPAETYCFVFEFGNLHHEIDWGGFSTDIVGYLAGISPPFVREKTD